MRALVVSTFEAKAKLSELLRAVARGRRVTITNRGRPVAHLIPVEPPDESFAERVTRLEADGALLVADRAPGLASLVPIATRPGALQRLLDERDDR